MKIQFVNPTVLSDKELESILPPIAVIVGENEVIYSGREGLQAPGLECRMGKLAEPTGTDASHQ